MKLFSRNTSLPPAVLLLQNEVNDLKDEVAAIRKNVAFIVFSPTGDILESNHIFADLTGYSTSELQDKHHRIFCDPSYSRM